MKENKKVQHNLDLSGKTIVNARLVNCKVEGVQTNPKVVEDIEELTGAQLDALKCGDVIVKGSNGHEHAYVVAYKDEDKGELSLVYTDHETIEEVYYEKTEGEWAFVVKNTVRMNVPNPVCVINDEFTQGKMVLTESQVRAIENSTIIQLGENFFPLVNSLTEDQVSNIKLALQIEDASLVFGSIIWSSNGFIDTAFILVLDYSEGEFGELWKYDS